MHAKRGLHRVLDVTENYFDSISDLQQSMFYDLMKNDFKRFFITILEVSPTLNLVLNTLVETW